MTDRIRQSRSKSPPVIQRDGTSHSTFDVSPHTSLVGALAQHTSLPNGVLRPEDVKWLQGRIGNRMVQRLLSARTPTSSPLQEQTTPVTQPQGGERSIIRRAPLAQISPLSLGTSMIQRWPWSKKQKKGKQKDEQDVESEGEKRVTQPVDNQQTQEPVSFLQPRIRLSTVIEPDLSSMFGRNYGEEGPSNQLVNDSAPSNESKNEKEERPKTRKAAKAPYHKLIGKFLKGNKDDIDLTKLEQAHKAQGALDVATPDYVDPALQHQEPDQYTITVAVTQERADWWDMVKRMRSVGLRKAFLSPIKFLRKVSSGEGESYLIGKVLKQQNKLPEEEEERTKAISEAVKNFDDVGHAWIRLSTRVKGKLQTLYSYGFYPRKIFEEGGYSMGKYVPGHVVHPDTKHEGDAFKRYFDTDISADGFKRALSLAQKYYNAPPAYHLLDYNCTKFAREILKAAGGTFPGKGVFPSVAFNPGQLYATLGKMQQKGNLKPGQRIYDESHDPDRDVIKDVKKEQEERHLKAYREEYQITPQDPKDYPEGIYRRTVTSIVSLRVSQTETGYIKFSEKILPSHGYYDIVVEDDMTETLGRARIDVPEKKKSNDKESEEGKEKEQETKKRSFYVSLVDVLKPGDKPTHTLDGELIDYSEPLPEKLTEDAVLALLRYRAWDQLEFVEVFPETMKGLDDGQIAKLAKLCEWKPEDLAREIAIFTGKVPPPSTGAPQSGNSEQRRRPVRQAPAPPTTVPRPPVNKPLGKHTSIKDLDELLAEIESDKHSSKSKLDDLLEEFDRVMSQDKGQKPSTGSLTSAPKLTIQSGQSLEALLSELAQEIPLSSSTGEKGSDLEKPSPMSLVSAPKVTSHEGKSLSDLLEELSGVLGTSPSTQQLESEWDEVNDLIEQLGGERVSEERVEQRDEEGGDDSYGDSHDDSQEEDSDEYEEIEMPEEILQPAVLDAIKLGEWGMLTDFMVPVGVLRSLSDEQIEALAEHLEEDPKQLKSIIRAL